MTSISGLPTPPPLNREEYEEYLNKTLPKSSTKRSRSDECSPSRIQYERKMGDTELSYFLPSRQSGVNDM